VRAPTSSGAPFPSFLSLVFCSNGAWHSFFSSLPSFLVSTVAMERENPSSSSSYLLFQWNMVTLPSYWAHVAACVSKAYQAQSHVGLTRWCNYHKCARTPGSKIDLVCWPNRHFLSCVHPVASRWARRSGSRSNTPHYTPKPYNRNHTPH
jgi:hypothetical protein